MNHMNRRAFLHQFSKGIFVASTFSRISCQQKFKSPNILFAISDDQSWPHTSAYGDRVVKTPAFDRIAREGLLFTNAFCAAPQCSPNRAAILTGRHIWQLEEAGTHASNFPKKFTVFTDILEDRGYEVGYCGKGWGPGDWRISGRTRNPAGVDYTEHTLPSTPTKGISSRDYSADFSTFIEQRDPSKPFCFWFGAFEPHRTYERGSGSRAGKVSGDVDVPGFLPDHPIVRDDILDYMLEIEWFDSKLGEILDILDEKNELYNTMVVVTSDNGMPFPRAKANLYEYGTHVPLAIRWPERVAGPRIVTDLVSFIDFAPTFLEAAGIVPPAEMTGRSFFDLLTAPERYKNRKWVLTGRERHTHARPDNLAYPSRALRTDRYLYILNLKPDRWPAGDPEGYFDIDGSPTKDFMIENGMTEEGKKLFALAFEKRDAEELYDIRTDPYCVINLAANGEYSQIKKSLHDTLTENLTKQIDPRMTGNGDIFESYPRYSNMRNFPGFKKQGEYNPAYQKAQNR